MQPPRQNCGCNGSGYYTHHRSCRKPIGCKTLALARFAAQVVD
jgi:hypothetical protein